MKILRKNDDFRKMPDSSINDIVAIKAMIDYGWKYCSRREYKDFFKKPEESPKIENDDNHVESSGEKTKKKKEKKKDKQ